MVAGAVLRAATATLCGCAVLAGADSGAEPDRDWSRVQLAWRDDPRMPADLPAGESPPRYPSRRAARRAARRGRPLDGVPVGVGRPAANAVEAAMPPPAPAPPPIRPAGSPPISVETTLGSPFTAPGDGVLSHRDLPADASGDPARRFDLHLPEGCAAGGLPLVVWIAGGDNWEGTRADCPVRWLVARGYAVACVGSRPASTAVFPAQLADCRAALATLVRDADTWGVDPLRICVLGRGAGGHLALLAALADADAAPTVAAGCAIAAPADLAGLARGPASIATAAGRLIGGPLAELREAARAASPVTHVSADDPPLLLVHGGRDAVVPADQAVRLDAACRAAGSDCRLVLLDAAGHDVAVEPGTPAGTAVLEFLERVLGPGAATPHDGAPSATP
jgi:acetyl esterase/lipase